MRYQLGSGSPLSCRSASQLPGAHLSPSRPPGPWLCCRTPIIAAKRAVSPNRTSGDFPYDSRLPLWRQVHLNAAKRALSSIRPSKDALFAADLRAVLQTEPHCCASLLPGAQPKLALLGFDEGRSALLDLDVHVQRRRHCQLWSLHRTHTQPLIPPVCTAVEQTRTPYTFLQLLIISSRFVSPPVCTAVEQTRIPYTFLNYS